MEENLVGTFIPKVFYSGPQTRISKQNQSLDYLVNIILTTKWQAKHATLYVHLALNNPDLLVPCLTSLKLLACNSFLYRKM